MKTSEKAVLVSGLFVLIVTYLLVVPGQPLWSPLGAYAGEGVMILGLVSVCAVCGAVFSAATGVGFKHLLVGGLAVYTVWLLYLEATAGPFDSPVHILLGIFFLVGFGFGAGVAEWGDQRGLVRRRALFR